MPSYDQPNHHHLHVNNCDSTHATLASRQSSMESNHVPRSSTGKSSPKFDYIDQEVHYEKPMKKRQASVEVAWRRPLTPNPPPKQNLSVQRRPNSVTRVRCFLHNNNTSITEPSSQSYIICSSTELEFSATVKQPDPERGQFRLKNPRHRWATTRSFGRRLAKRNRDQSHRWKSISRVPSSTFFPSKSAERSTVAAHSLCRYI